VVLCENHSLSQSDVNDVVTHELIHAYDHCRAKVDWDDCVHHACSEIRAANLSGDCFFGKEVRRIPFAHRGYIRAERPTAHMTSSRVPARR